MIGDTVRDGVLRKLRAAPKYRLIHEDTIADVLDQEAARSGSDAELERRARLKLHRVMADYLLTVRPARILRGMDEAVDRGPDAVRQWCLGVLASHFSTAERLPDLDRLYPAILDLTGPPASIVDLACALNPFTMPWLRVHTTASYLGYDLNLAYVELGSAFLARTGGSGGSGEVRHRDVLVRPWTIEADVALFLKTYHCVEDRTPGAGLRLVDQVAARHVVVSFPLRTMSGRSAVFTGPYLTQLVELGRARGWPVRRARLTSEELLVLTKDPDGAAQG